MTVSKSFVHEVLKQHMYEVLQLRNSIKQRVPAALRRNHTWGLDMTGKTDMQSDMHSILGIVDHGSHLAVCMLPLHDQTTIAILRALLDTIERSANRVDFARIMGCNFAHTCSDFVLKNCRFAVRDLS